jgi:K+-transporting ATPase KdpF subunit
MRTPEEVEMNVLYIISGLVALGLLVYLVFALLKQESC